MTIRVLELFCGTKSIGKHCKRHGYMYDVVSLDVDRKCNPTHLLDIMEWDYMAAYPKGYFHIIWASPPCTMYSVLRTTGGPRDIEGANAIVRRTLDIIDYYQPYVWFMENPATGYLKQQHFMQNLPYIDAHYCMYGYPYRKWTRIWTNVRCFKPKMCNMDCAAMVHDPISGCMRHRSTFGGNISGTPLHQRYSIPPPLVEELMDAACKELVDKSNIILQAQNINMTLGGRREAIRIRSVGIDNPSNVQEYSSISEAAKAIEGQCTQNNVRAALARCLSKNQPLAGRLWNIISDNNESAIKQNEEAQPAGSLPVVRSRTMAHPGATSTSKQLHEPHVKPATTTAIGSNDAVRLAELELQTQQAILKSKQVELLLLYLQKLKVHDDPSMHVLVKQYLT